MNKCQTLKNRFLCVILLVGLTLSGCSQGQNLPFKTIAKDIGFYTGQGYGGKEPDFLIITRSQEIDTSGLGIQFPSELAEQLRALDYQHNFAIVILRGLLSAQSPSYTVDILQISRAGGKVVLKVHFGEPGPNEGGFPAFSSPYHIIAVAKEGKWAREIHFVLEVDGKEVKEHTHFIP